MSDGASQANFQAASAGQSSGSWVPEFGGTTATLETVETVELSAAVDEGEDGDAIRIPTEEMDPDDALSDTPFSDELF